jgi:hypothetical protein
VEPSPPTALRSDKVVGHGRTGRTRPLLHTREESDKVVGHGGQGGARPSYIREKRVSKVVGHGQDEPVPSYA